MDNEYEPPRQRKKSKVKESIIDHTYRDYSQVEVSSDDEGVSVTDDKKQSRLQPNFPAKLHAIVSNPNYQHIVCWQVRQCTLDLSHSFIIVITFSLTKILFRCNSLLAPREELEDRGKRIHILGLEYHRHFPFPLFQRCLIHDCNSQDKHLLSTVICPKHFAHAKFESFNRSVNGWGFKVSNQTALS